MCKEMSIFEVQRQINHPFNLNLYLSLSILMKGGRGR